MYKIFADDTLIYDSTMDDYKIGKGQVTLEANKSGSFVFSIYPDHFYYDRFVKMRTVVTVYKSERIVFRGRVLNDATDYWNNKVLTCEGELGFLQDSIVRPFNFNGTPTDFFTQCVENHNAQVDEFKRFKVGAVTVVDSNDFITRSSGEYQTTLVSLTDRTLDSALGGYFHVTHGEDGQDLIPTLHYLSDFTVTASQVIEFGSNLKNYTKTVSAEEIATAIIPLGAPVDDGDAETDDPKLTIESVNGGVDYIYSPEAVAERGWITKVVEWEDVEEASNLLTKAREYLQSVVNQTTTIELNAVDLHLLDRSIESFNVCEYVRVTSAPHGIDTVMLCTKQTLDLLNPENDTVVLGATYSLFTENSNETKASVKKIATQINKNMTVVNRTIQSLSVQVIESKKKDLEPETYQVYGTVNTLAVNLVEKNDGLAHEYCFEFIPTEDFAGLTITPEVSWANTPTFPAGKTCQVSVMRGVALMIYA